MFEHGSNFAYGFAEKSALLVHVAIWVLKDRLLSRYHHLKMIFVFLSSLTGEGEISFGLFFAVRIRLLPLVRKIYSGSSTESSSFKASLN